MTHALKQVATSRAQVSKEPSESALIKIELLFGERVHVLGSDGDWTNVATDDQDRYEGFLRANVLVEPFDATHRVNVVATPVYATPSFKNPVQSEPLYYNSRVAIEQSNETSEGRMHKLVGSGWVFDSHLCAIDYVAADFVEECIKFLGIPYGYEKRGGLIDCSTLVQAGCSAAGIQCPYDVKSGEMEKLGKPVEFDSTFSNLRRGDLVFWTKDKGSHVVIMVDSENCLHATIAHRKCLIQPLARVIEEQARDHNGPVTSVRRFPDYASV